MSLLEWLAAVTTTTGTTAVLLALAAWLGKAAITARLTRSVQHEFDKDLATIRSDLSATEERLKGRLREREAEIAALRSGALSSLASRQAAVDKRRLEAIDQLWTAFNSLAPARALAATLSTIKFEAAAKQTQTNAKARQLFETLSGSFDPNKVDYSSANKARPFVSPMAWAIFSAYQAITMHSVMQMHVLKSGIGVADFTDHESIKKLILTALPHYREYLEKVGPSGYYYALSSLEERLLEELRAMLTGSEYDKATLEQAAEIIRQANELQPAKGTSELSERTAEGLG